MARCDGKKMKFVEKNDFLNNLKNPSYSWIISYHLLKKAFFNLESFENYYFNKIEPYDKSIDIWLDNADFLDEDSTAFIYNRYIAIRDLLIDKNPERVINFGCGLSPLGLSIYNKTDLPMIIDSDKREVLYYRAKILESSNLISKDKRYQRCPFEIGCDSLENFIKKSKVIGKTGVSFEGLFYYFDLKSIEETLLRCLQSDNVDFIVADYFLDDTGKKNKIAEHANMLRKSDLLNIFEKLNVSYYRQGNNKENQVVYVCEK